LLEALEKLWKEHKKNMQKIKARTMGRALLQKKSSITSKIKKAGQAESEQAKASITSATNGLQSSVKGQFGKKVIQVFEKQNKLLDKF
jgi:preprotein translocase subunit SecA